MQQILKQASDAGIHSGFPEYLVDWFEKAIDEGYGDEHAMALHQSDAQCAKRLIDFRNAVNALLCGASSK
mgnify:CR=1 FL=1